ncbi:bifunctional 2-polyprenyl-6-hydroxyphenol methylase/3-demethylubiquinol 3-O-methyltransferase UbiG [Streptomyces sp. MBT33]|uniref:class I SAM-dependent methyltransferase n=1 Tax=Streptomyces sp. MBT33 TaxID=1488363 RepID=UPI00190D21D3|nr:class I SAM-dependent methyltransferase [Streptomyces sp. MBT33]MBK3647949.1 class I SAM-dependent methyltransferase [Streptomyces sp. MBT33]
MTATTPDLWHHYGRSRAETDRGIPASFCWIWGQSTGPGPEVLGPLSGAHVADLGAGTARHAAHLAVHHPVSRIDAVDASPSQTAMALELFGQVPRLQILSTDAVAHLQTAHASYDVLYSVFGAVDFTDPHELLPAARQALTPGGRLVFSTPAHFLSGHVAEADVTSRKIAAKTQDGKAAWMPRWVLQAHAWIHLLDQAGFSGISVETWPAGQGPRPAATLLVSARRPA